MPTVRRPRLRDLDERFESRLLPLFTRRTQEVRDLLPELYLHGLASGDFELALRGLLGEQAALSASTVARAKERWQAEYSEWQQRRIEDEIGYLWLDGVYLKAGLEKEKAALLVAIGVKADGHKVVLAVTSGYRESTASWSGLLRDLKARGMNEPRLVVGDGNLGLWSALRNIFPGAEEQRCWNHRLVNLLTQVPKQRQGEARELLTKIPYQASERQARQQKRVFQNWCLEHGYERAAELIEENWEQMVSFYRFPRGHWRHLRTSNVVESPFAALRLRTDAPKRFKKVANATAVVWKTGLIVVGLKSLMFLGNSALMHRCMGANLHLSSGSFVQVREVSDRDSTLRKLGDDVQLPTQRLDVGTEVRDIHVSAPLQLGHRWLVHVQRLANRLLGHSPCLTQLVEGHCRTQLRFPTINAPAALRREVFRQLVESMSSTHMINPSCRNSSRCSS